MSTPAALLRLELALRIEVSRPWGRVERRGRCAPSQNTQAPLPRRVLRGGTPPLPTTPPQSTRLAIFLRRPTGPGVCACVPNSWGVRESCSRYEDRSDEG